jgi:hypothetical protein
MPDPLELPVWVARTGLAAIGHISKKHRKRRQAFESHIRGRLAERRAFFNTFL